MPNDYKGIALDWSYRLDLLIDYYLVVELKTVEQLYQFSKLEVAPP